MPLPRQDADVASVERWLEDVLPVNVVVAVSWKDLQVRTERQKTRVTDSLSHMTRSQRGDTDGHQTVLRRVLTLSVFVLPS